MPALFRVDVTTARTPSFAIQKSNAMHFDI